MKCVQCSADSNLKERIANQGRCKDCNHPFVFEPTSMGSVIFTDSFFAKAIADLSINNTLFFTPKQLFYFFDQKLKRKAHTNAFFSVLIYLFANILALFLAGGFLSRFIGVIAFSLVFSGLNILIIDMLFEISNSPQSSRQNRQSSINKLLALGIFLGISAVTTIVIFGFSQSSAITCFLSALIGLTALGLGIFQKRRITRIPELFLTNMAQMQSWLDSWTQVNDSVMQLPEPLDAPTSSTQSNLSDSDVIDYSFDRLVVCQTDAIAQMLIANNFHFENNCAILSVSGYPQCIFDTTMEMLRHNAELRVFAFHDCNPAGMKLSHQLRTNPSWFTDDKIVIVDIGLLPRQILAAKRETFVQISEVSAQASQNLPSHIRQNLSDVELQWLDAGNFVELESFPPKKLIQVLNRSIAMNQQMGTVEDSSFILVGDSGGYFYPIDSFG
jgi:hypothetical protein